MKLLPRVSLSRRGLLLSATSVGLALSLAGCDPGQAPPPNSSAPPSTNAASAGKTASVEQRVRIILTEQLGLKTEPKLTDRLMQDLGADSLDVVELVMAVEEAFNLSIPDAEAEKLQTLGDVIAFVTKAQKR